MFKHLKNEIWKSFTIKGSDKLPKKYMVSNLGRVATCVKNLEKDGELLKPTGADGIPKITIRVNDESQRFMVHRMVAQTFVKPTNKQQTSVIHINHKKTDNKATNLKWATPKEVTEHNYNSENMQGAFTKMAQRFIDAKKGRKLKLSDVIQIKKLLANPKRTLSYPQIAAKYGVSERAISRIKSGENWSLVTI